MKRMFTTSALLLAQLAAVQAAEIHVAPVGNDANPGTIEKPLVTIAAAQRAARQWATREPVTVLLHTGTYCLPETIHFTAADAGTKEAPVVYAAAPGETPVISGGVRLHLDWLPDQDGIFRASTPPGLAIDQLFVQGQRQHMARYPDYDPAAQHFNGSATDAIAPERVARWADPAGGYVHAMHAALWGDMHWRILGKRDDGSLDYEGGWQNNRPSAMHEQFRFVENIREELVGDPLFVDAAKGDFRVEDDSPALQLGFQNFAMDRFGVRSPRLRAMSRAPEIPAVKLAAGTLDASANETRWLGATFRDLMHYELLKELQFIHTTHLATRSCVSTSSMGVGTMQTTALAMLSGVCRLLAATAGCVTGLGFHSAWAQPGVDTLAATASSEWGAGYSAEAAADGIADENGNYWQTVEKKDHGAWWQADLGQVVPVRGMQIAWARYEDKYHAPPARVIVQLSNTGGEGPWQDVLTIEADRIPTDQAPFESERMWNYPFRESVPGRFVRLFFPDGDQPRAKYDGYICLGEVQIDAPGLAPQLVGIEGAFGSVEVNVSRPSWTRLYLRGSGGLGEESLLAVAGRRPWARGAGTYVVAEDGTRYESHLAQPDHVEFNTEGGRNMLTLTGVKLVSRIDTLPVATEDWTIHAPGDGEELVWKITRHWQRDCTAVCAGSPSLFFSFDARHRKNSTTSTLWYDPLRIAADHSALYAQVSMPGRISENHLQTIRDRDTWAIYKLWTNWNTTADLRLDVQGGHLYRRGSYAFLSEAGAVTGLGRRQSHRVGEVEEITLTIRAAEKQDTGYQLAVSLPDQETETALRDFYGSVFNGGAVNDQKGMDFGNETDGWYYAGSCWMYGATLAAGIPSAGPLSAHTYSPAEAFREHLAHVLSTLDEQGRVCFGYNQGGEWVDDNLHTIIGTRFYLLHSGDLPFVRQCLPALERMLAYFVQRRDPNGLFKLDDVGAHWYYDAIITSGVNGYYNAFFYKAACDLAEMERAAGRTQQAHEYTELATSIRTAFNRVFWKEDAVGGSRYLDWIDAQGNEVGYFCDLCQWPPIAVGIATPEQARKIVVTADKRIAELEKEHGYTGYASLSALWPVPEHLNPHAWQTFGRYMNGGSLLCQTYWEIVARSRAGDAAGAAQRLKRFAARAAETHWAGDNAATMEGEMAHGDGEPYLADMVAVTAAAIHGVLGIEPTWEKLTVTPGLPPDWSRAEADVLYKGQRHRVVIENDTWHIQPLEQVMDVPLLWVMDFNLRRTAYAPAQTTNVAFLGHYGDRMTLTEDATSGTYQSPAYDWSVPASLQELTVAAELNSAQVVVSVETSEDGFETIASTSSMAVRDGVTSYALKDAHGSAVRVRFDILRQTTAAASPIIDGFRVTATK